jgi:hypothetical protein
MPKMLPSPTPALVIGVVLAGICVGLLPAAELGAAGTTPQGLDTREIYAMAQTDLPLYGDKHQHYGILDPVLP